MKLFLAADQAVAALVTGWYRKEGTIIPLALLLVPLSGSSVQGTWTPPRLCAPAKAVPSGDLAQRIDRSLARLRQPPFTEQFILADVSFAEQRIFTEYSGDISGRLVGVLAQEVACGRPESWPLDSMLAALVKYQQPDGHFGKPQDLEKEVVGDRDMPILWGNGRLMVGLVEAYRATRKPLALSIARKLGDYYLSSDRYLDRPELVKKFGNYASAFSTCYFSGIEGLVGLWHATKDPRYLSQAKRMADLMARTTKPEEQHSHGRLCALRGLLDLYEATGNRAYLRRVTDEDRVIQERFLWPTGGISEMTVTTFNRDEGCTEADWLRLNLRLWRLTGDDAYLDLAEMTLKNEMAVNQFANGGFGHHVAAYSDGRMDGYLPATHKDAAEAYWCCSEHGPRALLDVAPYAIAVKGSDLYVNLYEGVDARIAVRGQAVRVTVVPEQRGQRALVRVQPERPLRFALHLRAPGWCSGFAVNDKAARPEPGGRCVVDRRWRSGDTVQVSMPFSVTARQDGKPLVAHALGATGTPASSGFLYLGPYLLGRPEPSETGAPLHADAARIDRSSLAVTVDCGGGQSVVMRPAADLAAEGGGFRVRMGVGAK